MAHKTAGHTTRVSRLAQSLPPWRRRAGDLGAQCGARAQRVGFAAIITFVQLLFTERGWGQAWIALTAFSAAFMVARVSPAQRSDGLPMPAD